MIGVICFTVSFTSRDLLADLLEFLVGSKGIYFRTTEMIGLKKISLISPTPVTMLR
jgi:hypothetical protein